MTKLKYTIKKDTLKGTNKKVYTLKSEGTKDAHYKFVKIRDAPKSN